MDAVLRRRVAVHHDLVDPVRVRQSAGLEQGTGQRAVQVRVRGGERTERAVADAAHEDPRERELTRVGHLRQALHRRVVHAVTADLRAEHQRVGGAGGGLVPAEGGIRAPGTGDRRERHPAGDPREQTEDDDGLPAGGQLAAGPEPRCPTVAGSSALLHGVIVPRGARSDQAVCPRMDGCAGTRCSWRERAASGLHFRRCREPWVPWTAEVTRWLLGFHTVRVPSPRRTSSRPRAAIPSSWSPRTTRRARGSSTVPGST